MKDTIAKRDSVVVILITMHNIIYMLYCNVGFAPKTLFAPSHSELFKWAIPLMCKKWFGCVRS